MTWQILQGDAMERLRELDGESVQTCVTSPPYWGLRDYGNDGQLGLESTPEEYVANLVAVFREVRRILRSDGSLWLNLGDSFAGKQLQGIPWRVAFALQADGWWLRSDIIWAKRNCMPESVTDRPTRSHEYLFLLTKSARYYFDQDAVREGMSAMLSDEAADGVLSASEPSELRLDMQGVREGEGQGMAGGGRNGKCTGSEQALCADADRQAKAGGMASLPDTEAIHGGISPKSRGQGGGKEGEPIRCGPGAEEAPRAHSQGKGVEGADQGEAPSGFGNRGNFDGRGVGDDLGGGEGAVRLLRGDHIADDGSHYAAQSGRATYEGERDTSLPELQRSQEGSSAGRNIRSVWHVATQPYPEAHFATFPPKLVEPCILAGSPPKCCGECEAPWERLTATERSAKEAYIERTRNVGGRTDGYTRTKSSGGLPPVERTTSGWKHTCAHDDDSGRSLVLDPFTGSGTTGVVALRHDRSFVGIELSPDYCEMARNRIRDDAPLLNTQLEAA